MPITVISPIGPSFGPGLLFLAHSDVISPGATDVLWNIRVTGGPQEREIISQNFSSTGTDGSGVIGIGSKHVVPAPTYSVPAGTSVAIDVFAQANDTGEIDSAHLTGYVWEPTEASWALAQQIQTSSGIDQELRQNITDTNRRTLTLGEPTDLTFTSASGPIQTTLAQIFSRATLDRLTLDELTNGPTCTPVRVQVESWFWAVIVRVTTIAPDLMPKTPDGNWYFPDLAVLRVFRGIDLERRRGIHTPTFIEERPWQWGWWFDSTNPIWGVPPDMTVEVDWREGCCGQVFLMSHV